MNIGQMRKRKEKKYYDSYEFDCIKKMGNFFGLDVKKYYDEYFLRYPKDYTSYPYYAGYLMKYGMFDEALNVLNVGFELAKSDKRFKSNSNKFSFLEKHYIIYLIKIYFYMGMYSEVLNIYDENYDIINNYISLDDAIIVYCKKMVGLLDISRDMGRSYLFRQIISYHEDDFREHIKKHLADDAVDMPNASKAIFVPDFPIDSVIEEIKKYIPSKNCFYPGGVENTYFFKYLNCGRDNYRMTDYFKVFCFHDTDKFITITPSCMSEVNFPCVDLNYLRDDDWLVCKNDSQIIKFNKKYVKIKNDD